MTRHLKRWLFFSLLATIVWVTITGLVRRGIASGDFKQPSACYYFSGQTDADLELAPTSDCFRSLVERARPDRFSHNIGVFQVLTYMDFVFIALYWAIFVLFAEVEVGKCSNWVIGFISLAGLFDILENIRILSVLNALRDSAVVQGLLPRPFSLVKWVVLALALGAAGTLTWTGAKRVGRLVSAALVLSSVLTLSGLVFPVIMRCAGFAFAIALVLLIVRYWPYSLNRVSLWTEYAYLMRFQILEALLLAVALPVGYYTVPSFFTGLFDGRGFWSYSFIVWGAFQLAWTIMVTCRLVLVYGPDRFAHESLTRTTPNAPAQELVTAHSDTVDRHTPNGLGQAGESFKVRPVGIRTVIGFGLLALPLVIVLHIGTREPHGVWKVIAALLGLTFAVAVLALTASLHFAIEDQNGTTAESVFPSFGFLQKRPRPKQTWFWEFVGRQLERLGPDLTAGILRDGKRLRSGHEMAAIALGVFLAFYVGIGAAFSPAWSNPERQPAALFFLMLVITIFTWLLSGTAFFLDRTRLPVFGTLLVVSLLTGFVKTDHEFAVMAPRFRDTKPLRPSHVIDHWKYARGKQNDKIITIVATAGGGIRAAAWTAEVMTRLQQHCENVSSSLVLVSSVSGGSVGAMFVVGPYSSIDGSYPVTDKDMNAVRYNASRSSLSAVGWGLAYPDLVRTGPILGAFVPQTFDRGWSLENAWATAWRDAKQPRPTMTEWRHDVQNGRRPAVIFNATVSESGERFLVSSTDTSSEGTEQFFDLYPNVDIGVATAARLSATFPYVSPLARASAGPATYAYHIGDGGYYDNSGLLSAVEWLRDAGNTIEGYKVVLILIDAKPGPVREGSYWSWQKQIVGPIQTLLHVRTSSQELRDHIELDMATKYLAALGNKVEIIPAPFLFSSDSPAPLSWHLTEQQMDEIRASWEHSENMKSRDLVYGTLGCPVSTGRSAN
jgi:hypothetical protein